MKNFIFVVVLLLSVLNGFSQAQIDFRNDSGAFVDGARIVTVFPGGPGLTGTNFVAQLFLASDYSAVLVEGPSLFRIPTTIAPGTWSGGLRHFLPNYQQGTTLDLVVRVWDSTFSSSYDEAINGGALVGQSAAFTYLIPTALSPPSAFVMQNFQGFFLIPEPSTMTLGMIGLGALGLMKRRKRN